MYIEQFSVWRDLQLILQTAGVLLKSDSAEAFDKKRKKTPYVFPGSDNREEKNNNMVHCAMCIREGG